MTSNVKFNINEAKPFQWYITTGGEIFEFRYISDEENKTAFVIIRIDDKRSREWWVGEDYYSGATLIRGADDD